MRLIKFAFREALINLRRGGRSVLISVGTIAAAFSTLGGFLLVAANLQTLVDRWASAAELSIYLKDDVQAAARAELETELRARPEVAAVEYVSKDQALARFRSDFPELADVAGSVGDNPFPSSIEIRLRPDAQSDASIDALADAMRERDAVADVRYDRQWLARVLAVASGVRAAGLAVASILIVGAAFTVGAVVQLSLAARRDEIEIMQLVGAPFAYIRGPSIVEGMLLGAVGAALALVLLWTVFEMARDRASLVLAPLVGAGEMHFLGLQDSALLVLSALAIGGLAGVVASRGAR